MESPPGPAPRPAKRGVKRSCPFLLKGPEPRGTPRSCGRGQLRASDRPEGRKPAQGCKHWFCPCSSQGGFLFLASAWGIQFGHSFAWVSLSHHVPLGMAVFSPPLLGEAHSSPPPHRVPGFTPALLRWLFMPLPKAWWLALLLPRLGH